MQPVQRHIADQFAEAFAGDKRGFSGREVTEYFRKYSFAVRPYEHYGVKLKRSELFVESLYHLSPKQQYLALHNLTQNRFDSKYDFPSERDRAELRSLLHNSISPTPIGLKFSSISEVAFREDWVTCQSRLETDPASAITAARTMLETLLKTVVSERGEDPIQDDLPKLYKQAINLLLPSSSETQIERQLLSGLNSVVSALAGISNAAGDRHGTIGGVSLDDSRIAELCINAAGTLGLNIIELHLFNGAQIPPNH